MKEYIEEIPKEVKVGLGTPKYYVFENPVENEHSVFNSRIDYFGNIYSSQYKKVDRNKTRIN